MSVNVTTELVVDLLAATGLVPADKLALVRSRAASGSITQAMVDEGVASGEGIARTLAVRHQVPLVDLALAGVDKEAAQAVPLHVLERVVAVPYALENGTLRIAIADPGNIHGIDELRLATRYPIDVGVASRDDVLAEIKRMVRASEAFGARAVLEEAQSDLDAESEGEDGDDLEAEDGISDAPLVRLVNSVIFQAAEDGASDVHFEPQEDALVVRFRVDGVLQEVQRIPRRMTPGVTTRLKVLAKLDIAERRKPQDGRISLERAGRRPHARHPRRDAADGRRREGRHASARQVSPRADPRGARALRRDARPARRDPQAPDRCAPRHGADRLR